MGPQGPRLGSLLGGAAVLSLQPLLGSRRSTMVDRGRVALGRAFFAGAGREWAAAECDT